MEIIDYWPIIVGCAFLALAAGCEWQFRRVPNALCFPFSIAGLAVAVLGTTGHIPNVAGDFMSSISGLTVGFASLIFFYNKVGLGAGCVKAQATFGIWAGCAMTSSACISIMILTSVITLICYAIASRFVDREEQYLFPAQITLSLGSIVGAMWWLGL